MIDLKFHIEREWALCLVWPLLIVASLGAGCSSDALTALGTSSAARVCSDDSACPADSHCAPTIGACVSDSPYSNAITVQIVPPGSAALATSQVAVPADLTSVPIQTALSECIVGGWVKSSKNALGSSVPGRIVAETPGEIDGTVLRSESTVFEGVDDRGWSFELRLIPGRPYRITFYPDDESRPPKAVEKTFGQGVTTMELSLPALEDYPVIQGFVYDAAAAPPNKPAPPLGGVRVIAIEVQEEGNDAPRLTSTAAVTDSKLGSFRLTVPPVPATYSLRFEPTTEMDSRLIIRTQTDPKFLRIEVDGQPTPTPIAAGQFLMETYPRTSVRLEIVGADGQVAVPNAAVLLSGTLNRGTPDEGTVQVQGYTMGVESGDFAGVWNGVVPPGTYTVSVSPPKESPFASWEGTVDVVESGVSQTIQLGTRLKVTGQVIGWDGTSVAGANVSGQLRTDESAGPASAAVAALGTTLAATTDADGAFELYADAGTWRFSVAPPGAGPYPRLLDAVVDLSESNSELWLELPVPHLVQGIVQTDSGSPIANANVAVHANAKSTGVDATLLSTLLGDGITDESGEFLILIPPL